MLGTEYQQVVLKTDNYTLTVSDDVVKFTIASGKTATLPLAQTCTPISGQHRKIVANSGSSSGDLTVAASSGNTLTGTSTIHAGGTGYLTSDGVSIWNCVGASGALGSSGFSGFSGASGYTGSSGYTGYSGSSGKSGFTGISGYTGFTGFSGKSGYTGFSAAASGYSGFTGVSGFSGFTGV